MGFVFFGGGARHWEQYCHVLTASLCHSALLRTFLDLRTLTTDTGDGMLFLEAIKRGWLQWWGQSC
jgi:hypothetical protein